MSTPEVDVQRRNRLRRERRAANPEKYRQQARSRYVAHKERVSPEELEV